MNDNYKPRRAGKKSADDAPQTRRDIDYDEASEPESDDSWEETARKGSIVPGLVITGIMVVLILVFDVYLTVSQMIPLKILVPIFIALFLLVILIAMLVATTARRARFCSGVIVSVLTAAILIYGLYLLSTALGTLNRITGSTTEIAHVGVYVLTDDPAETLNDLTDYTFGLLSTLDRSSSDKALAQIEESLGVELSLAEYDGLTSLIDALYQQECGTIVLNTAYLDVIEEIEGYEDLMDRIREITTLELEEEVKSSSDSDSDGDTTSTESTSDHVFTVYISGIDSRNGLIAKSRSDVNILATVNTETHQVLLISTPRDYYIPLSISNGQCDKLTHAGIYGVSVSMETLEMLYDIDVDYYFRVNFEGFEDIVDALGGITVYSDYTFTSTHGGYSFVAGYNDMNGEEALSFVRERYAFSEGDRQRGKNQMAVIKAIINKVISPDILRNYSSLMSAVSDSFETSIPYDLIASLVNDQLSSGGSWDVVSYSVDGTGDYQIPYSMSTTAWVMIPDEETVDTAKELLAQIYADQIVTAP